MKYIPWRFQSKTNFMNSYSNFIFRKLLNTSPIPCVPDSDCIYSTVTCHRDVTIAILAIKSFLRFFNQVSVAIQDDGSLTGKDKNLFEKHIPGCLIYSRETTDKFIKPLISDDLFAARKKDPSMLKLIDTNILFDKKKIVADSDILFLKKPDEIIDWICEKQPAKPFYHKVNEANKVFEDQLGIINAQLSTNIDKLDYCSGFIGFNDQISIEKIEKTFKCLSKVSNVWGLEQNIYAFLLKEQSIALSPEHYVAITQKSEQELFPVAKMMHFGGKFKHKQYLIYGNIIISDLMKGR